MADTALLSGDARLLTLKIAAPGMFCKNFFVFRLSNSQLTRITTLELYHIVTSVLISP